MDPDDHESTRVRDNAANVERGYRASPPALWPIEAHDAACKHGLAMLFHLRSRPSPSGGPLRNAEDPAFGTDHSSAPPLLNPIREPRRSAGSLLPRNGWTRHYKGTKNDQRMARQEGE